MLDREPIESRRNTLKNLSNLHFYVDQYFHRLVVSPVNN